MPKPALNSTTTTDIDIDDHPAKAHAYRCPPLPSCHPARARAARHPLARPSVRHNIHPPVGETNTPLLPPLPRLTPLACDMRHSSTSTPRAKLSHTAEPGGPDDAPPPLRVTSNLAKPRSSPCAPEGEAEGGYNPISSTSSHARCLQSPPPHRAEDHPHTLEAKVEATDVTNAASPKPQGKRGHEGSSLILLGKALEKTRLQKRRSGVRIPGAGGQSRTRTQDKITSKAEEADRSPSENERKGSEERGIRVEDVQGGKLIAGTTFTPRLPPVLALGRHSCPVRVRVGGTRLCGRMGSLTPGLRSLVARIVSTSQRITSGAKSVGKRDSGVKRGSGVYAPTGGAALASVPTERGRHMGLLILSSREEAPDGGGVRVGDEGGYECPVAEP
ncbi:hypothetical protein B0H16DRAFT_1847816 [Mycena metata]|uniref:Uncharacterized protein n=1 Tax=Mycena metata TaxID=1033252 RepID=A0AAD7N769_9AGAR|nr:hypothetical protein B0H16DRAFT_1847816 [Mycena metata]